MAAPFGFPLRPGQRIFDQVWTEVPGVAIPGIGKISQGSPGVLSLTDALVGTGHSIDGGGRGLWFFVRFGIPWCLRAKYLKGHPLPSFPFKEQGKSMLDALVVLFLSACYQLSFYAL